MIGISIYNEKEIDTDSLEIKETVSNSIKEYIMNNWNQCVSTKKSITDDICVVQFNIEL